jgi:hypothetical protein
MIKEKLSRFGEAITFYKEVRLNHQLIGCSAIPEVERQV